MSDRLRVLHVLPHGRALGGTERTVLELLGSPLLRELDQRVVFVQPGRVTGFDRARVLGGRGGAVAALPAIARWRPQILHGWLLQGNVVAALLTLVVPSVRLVTSERNLGRHAHPRFKRTLERFVARREDVATANSVAVRDAAVQRVPRRARAFRVIAPGIVAPTSAEMARPATAVAVGRLHPVKDHVTALRAWRRVVAVRPEATLTIVGGGPERDRLEQLSRELQLDRSVSFRGAANPAADLEGARMFLLSSRSEGFPRVVLEALSAGLPVVCTDVGGVAEIGGSAVRIAPVGDDKALAEHVLGWLRDPGALAHATAAARPAAERFAPAACHRAYRDLYAQLETH